MHSAMATVHSSSLQFVRRLSVWAPWGPLRKIMIKTRSKCVSSRIQGDAFCRYSISGVETKLHADIGVVQRMPMP